MLRTLRGMPDDGPLPAEWFRDDNPNAAHILVDTPEELATAFNALNRILDTQDYYTYLRPTYIDDVIKHEAHGHAPYDRALGFSVVKLGFRIDSVTDDRDNYTATPFTLSAHPIRPITKLGLAGSLAAPHEPSDDDISQLTKMGYASAREVGERIIRANTEKLGIPQSYYRKGAGGVIDRLRTFRR